MTQQNGDSRATDETEGKASCQVGNDERLPDEHTLEHWRVDVYAAFKCMCCGEDLDFGGDTDLWTVFESLHDHEDTCGLGTA